mgnify:CR=1 FL=1
MDDQNKNLILASVLSMLVLIAWFVLFPPPVPDEQMSDAADAISTPVELPAADQETQVVAEEQVATTAPEQCSSISVQRSGKHARGA